MRGADAGPGAALCALPALWVGTALRSSKRLTARSALIARLDRARSVQALRACRAAPRDSHAPFRDGTVRGIAREMVALAQGGLARRARRDLFGKDEGKYLAPLAEIVETGRSASDRLLADYRGPWEGDIDKVFTTAVL